MTTYRIDKRFTTRVDRSDRVLEVAAAFGIGLEDKEFIVFDNLDVEVKQGDVVYITGQSGSGKSLMLRDLYRQMLPAMSCADIDKVELDNSKSLIDQIGTSTNDALRLLSATGINDAYLFVRKPSELSDGQRYRFRLAKMVESGAKAWFADEFMAVLDRTSAKIIANAMAKTARRAGATLVVATTHTDLAADLDPDLYVEKRFREKLQMIVKP